MFLRLLINIAKLPLQKGCTNCNALQQGYKNAQFPTLIVDLICISFVSSEAERFLICLLSACNFSLVNCLLMSIAHF